MEIAPILILFIFVGGSNAFVYSCNEIKYQLLNSKFDSSTSFACLAAQWEFVKYDAESMKNVYITSGNSSTSFYDLLNTTCIERQVNDDSWQIVADPAFDLNCKYELSLIFTSSSPSIKQYDPYWIVNSMKHVEIDAAHEQIFAEPQTGIRIHMLQCSGDGNITLFTGAGRSEEESRYPIKSWKCTDLPNWIVTFDNVITISTGDETTLSLEFYADQYRGDMSVAVSDRVAVMSSGLSDNLQNLRRRYNYNAVQFDFRKPTTTTAICSSCSFDPEFGGLVNLNAIDNTLFNVTDTQTFTEDGQFIKLFQTERMFSVEYLSRTVSPRKLGTRQDTFVLELSFAEVPLTPPTPTVEKDPYCSCPLNRNKRSTIGWTPRDIWVDVVIVVDTSEAMTDDDLYWVSALIGWIFDTSFGGGLETNTKKEFYTRVGMILMSNEAKVMFNLNMTVKDADPFYKKIEVTEGLSEINFDDAFNAAQTMLEEGRKPERSSARQIVYFITDSEPHAPIDAADQFITEGGIIIVNNYIKPNETRPGLFWLASPGYYLSPEQWEDNTWTSETDEMITFQLFCKANCYCRSDLGRSPYNGHNLDPAVSAAGGCFRAEPTKNQFVNARKNCDQLGGGKLVSIHDPQKGAFVQELMSRASTKSDYFWIGYTRTDTVDGKYWDWEDKSTNPYTNWADHQPGKASNSKCAYVEKSTSLWGDGNCNIAYPSVCEFAPCEIGNKNC